MKSALKSPFTTALAITIGIVILIGYFVDTPLFQNLRFFLLEWAVILGGVAGLVSIFNLVSVHWRKMRNKDGYSPLLILAFLITLAAGLILGPSNIQFQKVVTFIQVPVETSLMAILTFSLIFAVIRLFQMKKSAMAIIFLISTFIFLLISSSYLTSGLNIPGLDTVLSALHYLPIAGARGLLLGISLGGITAGIRILIGVDRPYRE
jgi:hypothetical protein